MRIESRQSKNNQSERDYNLVEEQLLTPEEAANILKVTTEQIRCLIRKGLLPAINIGSGKKKPLYRIVPNALNDFLKSRWQPTPAIRKKRFKQLAPAPDFFPNLK